MKQNIWSIWRAGAVVTYWVDRFCRQTPRISIIGSMWFITGWPKSAYHLSYEVEDHAAHTYSKYLKDHPDDVKIEEIMNDEINHREELLNYPSKLLNDMRILVTGSEGFIGKALMYHLKYELASLGECCWVRFSM